MRRRLPPRRRFLRTASTRRSSCATGWRTYGESTHVEFVPFGVDEHAFVPSTGQAGCRRRLRRSRPTPRCRALPSCGCRAAEPHVPAGQHGRSHTRARSAARRTWRSRSTSRSTRCGAGCERLASSHCPSSRTATRARRRCSSRRWRSGSPSSSRGRRRSRPGTGSSTARTAGSSLPATTSCSSARVKEVLRDEWRGRALGAGARRAVEDGLTWTRYVDRIEQVLLGATERHEP